MDDSLNIDQLVRRAGRQLKPVSDTPLLDARLLFRFVSNFSDTELIRHANQQVADGWLDAYERLIDKRKAGMPVAYLTGVREFWSMQLKVTRDTLIPRPETELLVETALGLINDKSESCVLDLGTGSGAIALALASNRPKAKLTASDLSQAALDVARFNAQAHQMQNIEFIRSHWYENLTGRRFDMIVSNPPYVASADYQLLDPDVRFEPQQALFSGIDGLDDLKLIIRRAKAHLTVKGYLLVEHANNQPQQVADLFKNAGFEWVKNFKDLNQQPRVTIGCLI